MFDLIPFDRSERSLFNMFDSFEKEFFNSMNMSLTPFKTDIIDKGDHYSLQADLPGFAKEDIKIDIDGDYLLIKAEHNEEKNETQNNYVTRERRYGSFERSFNISNIKPEGISAEYKNGVLELKLPKDENKKERQRSIEIR